ncbi:MAG: succinylglutamate desuccinylase/aspartoacylase family protein [Thermodesulfobacteriota bacterium]
MKRAIKINGRLIPRGGKEFLRIEVASHRSAVRLPVCVWRGEEDGPVLLITAGLHGDELNGVETLRRMIASGSIVPDTGTVIALPIANVWGFLNSSRFLPDGMDLNRGFPGARSGTLSQKIALAVMRDLLPAADCGLDLHSGGVSENYPHIRCTAGAPVDMELARAFAPPFILDSPLMEGTFRKAARLSGKSVLVYEGGESRRISEFAVSECMNGILRLMDYLGMTTSGAPERNETRVLRKCSPVRAAGAGDFDPRVKCGAEVRKGDILAAVSNPESGDRAELTARDDGFALSVRHAKPVNTGDVLINLAVPV